MASDATGFWQSIEYFLCNGHPARKVQCMLSTVWGSLRLENCVSFLDPLIESWDIDLSGFVMQIVLNRRLAPGYPKRFEFVETESDQPLGDELGLRAFLKDASLSGNVTQQEIEFLRRLKVKGKRPTPLYYYRELQNLRDLLHFTA